MTKKKNGLLDIAPDIALLSFEEAMAELEQVVKRMEQGGSSLEQSIADYARGNALKTHCEKKLAEAKIQVEQIISQENGEVVTTTFEAKLSE